MDKEIGIVVCNYNKQDYIINCVKSILNSTINNFDVCVVDNASTDSSVDLLKKEFGNQIELIVNDENLGGSGGFNTGLREALKRNYRYYMLIDNDVVLEDRAIEELYHFMELHEEVGMAGSKMCVMDYPDRIQTFGAAIDFVNYGVKDFYRNCKDDENIPELIYCDYVPACSLMVRAEVVKKIGIMQEDNFIYWDDMEWGYRFNKNGYKVAACSKSRIWHKRGSLVSTNTFQKYYMFRNRINFFSKNIPDDDIENFSRVLLKEMFYSISGCSLKQDDNMIKTFMYAYDDAIHQIRGRADEYKILPRTAPDRLHDLMQKANTLLIQFNDDYEAFGNVIAKVDKYISKDNITISVLDCNASLEDMKQQHPQYKIVREYSGNDFDLILKVCDHVFNVKDLNKEAVYIDKWINLIIDDEDFQYCKSIDSNFQLFLKCHLPVMVNQILKMRKGDTV